MRIVPVMLWWVVCVCVAPVVRWSETVTGPWCPTVYGCTGIVSAFVGDDEEDSEEGVGVGVATKSYMLPCSVRTM